MYREVLEEKIEKMFNELKQKSHTMLNSTSELTEKVNDIIKMISSEITLRSKTMIIDLYYALSTETLSSDEFRDISRQNAFYELDISKKIFDKYQFKNTSLNKLPNDMKFNEVNNVYTSLAIAAGTVAIGGVLKYALYNTVNVPIVVIIAGAVMVFCYMYFKKVPDINRQKFLKELDLFLDSIKKDLFDWFAEVEKYYNDCVEDLKRNF